MKTWKWTALITLIVAIAVSYFARDDDTLSSAPGTSKVVDGGGAAVVLPPSEVERPSVPRAALPSPPSRESDADMAWITTFRPVAEVSPKAAILEPMEAKARVAELAASAARGDSTAALSLNELARLCVRPGSRQVPGECSDLPSTMAGQPYRWLLLAADLHDPRASLPLLGTSRDVIRFSKDEVQNNVLSTAALASLESSVSQGSQLMLWRSYRTLTLTAYWCSRIQSRPMRTWMHLQEQRVMRQRLGAPTT
jgi:hypothetical protein